MLDAGLEVWRLRELPSPGSQKLPWEGCALGWADMAIYSLYVYVYIYIQFVYMYICYIYIVHIYIYIHMYRIVSSSNTIRSI